MLSIPEGSSALSEVPCLLRVSAEGHPSLPIPEGSSPTWCLTSPQRRLQEKLCSALEKLQPCRLLSSPHALLTTYFPRRFYIYCVLLRGENTVLAEQASTGGAPVPLTVCGGPGRPCPRSGAAGARPCAQPAAPLPSDTAPLQPGWNHRRCWSLPGEEWLRSSGDRAEYRRHQVNSLIERLKSKEQPTQRKPLRVF